MNYIFRSINCIEDSLEDIVRKQKKVNRRHDLVIACLFLYSVLTSIEVVELQLRVADVESKKTEGEEG